MGMQIDKNILDLSLAVMETPTRLFQSTKIVTDLNEYKISRFGNPNNRWGIFEGRNQVESISFTVNQALFVTAIGIGNAFHEYKTVLIENLRI